MLLIYSLALRIYYIIVFIFSFFNKKAKLWIQGRQHIIYSAFEQSIWFHFASLGEFEQGRPVLEQLRNTHPQRKIIITFFSPSGYEIRKNTPLADAVYYLPLDTAGNARKFIDAINPTIAVFTKYEYWYYFFREINKRNISLYIISGIFRPNQVFFKWYGGLHRKMLSFVSHFFVQDDQSEQLLKSLNISNTTISGDTRFDRVWTNALHPKPLPEIAAFKNGQKVFIAGSTWPADEQLIAALAHQHPDWKFIIAPHEINKENIDDLIKLLPENSAIKYAQLTALSPKSNTQTLIIDNIGMLSALYQYGQIAYIGGGFGAGIHNTLEAAAFGLPIIFGPNYAKFKEAKDIIALGAGFSISRAEELKKTTASLINDEPYRLSAGKKAKDYVVSNIGATGVIVEYIEKAGRL
jgi:3-deoxy-D-manno-octulosonic-acid transferase